MSRLTAECRACGWSESAPTSLVGDAAETADALWRIHDGERPDCSAFRGKATLDSAVPS